MRQALRTADLAIEGLCVVLLALTVLATVLQVVFRYLLNDALVWSEEFARWCFVWSIYLGFAVVTGRDKHMRIDLLSARAPASWRPGIALFGSAVGAAAAIAMLLHGGAFALQVTSSMGALQWPSRYLYGAVPVGGALTLVYLAFQRNGLYAVAGGAALFVLFLKIDPIIVLPWSVGWVLHVAAIGLMCLDVPIAYALIFAAYVSFAPQGALMVLPIAQHLGASVNSFLLLSIPFFILAGQVMNAGGITHYLVRFAGSLVGHMRGGLAQVNIVAQTAMAGLSGSSLAVAVGMTKAVVPEMERRGYPKPFACALTASASTIDNLIPPSIGLIVFASVSSASVGALFTAGILPGIAMALGLMAVVHWQAGRRGFEASSRPATLRERLLALRDALPALLVPVLIVGGMRAGAFTASEAGAMAVVYAVLIGVLAYRRFRFRDTPSLLREAMIDTVAIIAVVAASAPFGWALAIERIPQVVAESLAPLASDKVLFLLAINVFLLVVGLAMEFVASLVIVVPILLPLVVKAGVDPVHFGIICVMNLVIGALTPPLGVLVFATASVGGAPITAVYREVTPFLCALIAVLFAVTYVPAVSLWLPRLLGY